MADEADFRSSHQILFKIKHTLKKNLLLVGDFLENPTMLYVTSGWSLPIQIIVLFGSFGLVFNPLRDATHLQFKHLKQD